MRFETWAPKQGWTRGPLKRAACVGPGDARPNGDNFGLVPLVGANGVIGAVPRGNLAAPAVIVGRVGTAGAVNVVNPPAWISDNALVVSPGANTDLRFLSYVLQVLDLPTDAAQTAQPLITQTQVRERVVPIPPLTAQVRIADFIDIEIALIDGLTTRKRRTIELVDEYRRGYVGEVVTCGTDSLAGRVRTGNEFAPEIAAGWRLLRLRHVVREIVDTAHKTAPIVENGDYVVVRTANVKAGRLVLDDARYTDHRSWKEWTHRGVPAPGDVLFTREAPAGEACLVPDKPQLCIGQRMVLLRPRRDVVLGSWLLHSIYSGAAQRFIEVLSRSTTVAHINMSDIPDIPVVVPPLGLQKDLLKGIATVERRCDLITRALAKQIELLEERRQALITAAVAGELEIPGTAA